MRDWSKGWWPASFRGVPFWVERDGPYRGRRVAVHQISGGEAAVTEDLGLLQPSFRVEAYVADDLADAEGLALEAACQAKGPSVLVLPMDGPASVHCLSCQRDRRLDKNGRIGYRLEFVVAGAAGAVRAGGVPAMRSVFRAGLSAVTSAIAGVF
ncbi:DNA circularization N-terminal domain-containing protein [Afifella sp. IM 167]|uniref:DNA circularization N-terminal domain-containing protein n=1 Tax=Afifella sp. IM 167 TaxID=2033586 RepID=UPI001CCCB125|nr:DNA circularization N-terminal domain-containing protein [Afifella sp. IM 167]MBZ8133222.1 hypothetical protein [Afifella sp. IM 167]